MRWIIALAGAALLGSALAGAQQPLLPEIELGLGMYLVRAEVADRTRTRAEGLMRRQSLAQSHGMLFVFGQPDKYCMWMKNTLVPLSVAFIDARGQIVNIADMQPQTEEPHCAARAVPYALEMNQGWFAQRGIGAGSQLRGLEQLHR